MLSDDMLRFAFVYDARFADALSGNYFFLTQNFMLTITVIDILKPSRIRNRKIIFQKGFRQLMTFEGLELQEYTDYISLI